MRQISVDIGGTFTDCFLVWDQKRIEAKAPTTHFNLSEGFMNALKNAAEELGESVDRVLAEITSVRYATTLGTNALIERSGPRLGLVTTAGFEDSIVIGRCRQYADGLPAHLQADLPGANRPLPLIGRDCIVGIRERIDHKGKVLIRPDADDIRARIQELVDKGVRGFVVALVNSITNPRHEDLVEEILLEEYPTSYLGSFPVICSHDISLKKGEYTRTMSSIIAAYLQREMQFGLRSLAMALKKGGYQRPMQVVHNTGGMSQLNRTHALQTVHAGPVAGLSGSEQFAEELEIENLITTDMGGTSFDIGLIAGGGIKFYEFTPVIDRWRVDVPMMFLSAIGAGGGSIARYNSTIKSITVGPESAGSEPGPACFDMGGTEATVTDADLLLGHLNPEYYNEGRTRLNARRAERAIAKVGQPLGMDVRAAAVAIRSIVDSNMAQAIFKEVALKGFDPRKFSCLVYGGSGPTHACGYAEGLGIKELIIPLNAAVFSAVGAGNLDQVHIYDRTTYVYLYNAATRKLLEDYAELNGIIDELKAKGLRDIVRLGYRESDVQYRVELDLRYGDQLALTTLVSPYERFTSIRQVFDVVKRFHSSFGQRFGQGSQTPEVGVNLNNVRVVSFVPLPKVALTGVGSRKPNGKHSALKTSRSCHFPAAGGFVDTPVYDHDTLTFGDQIRGPAIVEAPHTTIVVYPSWKLELNEAGYLSLRREA
jgi:N-methylhydantoinase A